MEMFRMALIVAASKTGCAVLHSTKSAARTGQGSDQQTTG